ncbi:hypothetical protein Sfulv_37370 [Streptomyces fulvorobeus]|uniref:Uncharacterized protein n=1 Tax=Streptomyces fulvorobeus TaxID=284028 RepID=A0A7J0CB28_9ACTN|nr:hypothetical protein Sfulv_37370 [Streptomyces fulvorobeus]
METGAGKGAQPASGTDVLGADGRRGAGEGGSGGAGIALAIMGGLLLALSASFFLVNRRWPLPDLVRRLPRR